MPTKHFTREKIKQRYNLFAEKPRYQTGMLGNAAGVVRASRNHYVYVRLRNGEVVEAYNDRVPSTAGRPVILRWERGRWLVETTWQVFEEPLWDGVGEHAETHDLYGSDPLFARAGQILPGLVIPKPGELSVIVCHPLTELYETIDLSDAEPESGAIWALIECDPDDGTLSVTTGGAAASYGELDLADIPTTTGIALAALKLYSGQQEIIRSKIASDVVDLRWFKAGGGGGASDWGDIGGTLSDQTDLQAALDAKTDLDIWENNASAGRLWGGIITDAGSGTVDIAAGAGLIKTGGSSIDGNTGIPTSLNEGQGSETSLVTWDAIEDFPLAGVGYNLVFWDASEEEFAVALKENFYSVFNFVTDFTIGRVYYDGTTAISRLFGMNRCNFERRVQMFGEERFPVERATGLMLSGTGTRNIAITAGVLWAELVNRFSTDAFDSSGAGRFTYWYRDGSGGWTAQTSQSQINNTQYDDGDGTLGTLTNNRYGVHWVFVAHDSSVHVVYGRTNASLTASQDSGVPTDLPGIVSAYGSFIGRVIIQKSAAAFTEVDSAFTTVIAVGAVPDHNDLSG